MTAKKPNFDPNAAASDDSGIFGLPHAQDQAALVYLPVPWEATTSYGGGTSRGPAAILEASRQVDLFDLEVEKPYAPGLFMLPEPEEVAEWNREAKVLAGRIIEKGGNIEGDRKLEAMLDRVNMLGGQLNEYVKSKTRRLLREGKIVALVGGDHSTPFGALEAMAETQPEGFGILHFDAHSDTRDAFEGFTWSHASIMRNVLDRIPQVSKLVQVGVRDFCEEELAYVAERKERVGVYFDGLLARRKFLGESWSKISAEIVSALPRDVWISFDIDGLDQRFCPHTGTPVPGGLEYNEACYLIAEVARSGRRIIGFDLNEVAPHPEGADEWDANVGARLLYKLTGWCLASQGKVRLTPRP